MCDDPVWKAHSESPSLKERRFSTAELPQRRSGERRPWFKHCCLEDSPIKGFATDFRVMRSFPFFVGLLLIKASAFGELKSADCARAAKYSESKRGTSMLVMQRGKIIFEHYANGGLIDGALPIFSGTKSFWGIVALVGVGQGLFKLEDRVSDTITEWRSDPRKSQITIRQLLNFTDGIEGAPHLHRESIRDRNALAIQLPLVAPPGNAFIYGPSHLQVFSE